LRISYLVANQDNFLNIFGQSVDIKKRQGYDDPANWKYCPLVPFNDSFV
jgi:hypothetical protein